LTSKERDAESGLDYFGARYYSSAQGRFTSPDEFKGGFLDAFSGQAAFQPGPLPYADISDPQTLNNTPRLGTTRFDTPTLMGTALRIYAIAFTAAVRATAGLIGYLRSPQGQDATRAFVVGTGALINKAVDGLSSLLPGGSTQSQQMTGAPVSTSQQGTVDTSPVESRLFPQGTSKKKEVIVELAKSTADQYRTVHCDRHGDRREAFVCDDLLHGEGQGFFSGDDPGNPHPDAWCYKCDHIRASHGGSDGEWNEKSIALVKIRLVCGDCYEEIKARNILGTEVAERIQ
jgi:RHS repeat-associated protein